MAAKLSQSIYWVESILSKCHEEGELLFFTIRTAEQPQVLLVLHIQYMFVLVCTRTMFLINHTECSALIMFKGASI